MDLHTGPVFLTGSIGPVFYARIAHLIFVEWALGF